MRVVEPQLNGTPFNKAEWALAAEISEKLGFAVSLDAESKLHGFDDGWSFKVYRIKREDGAPLDLLESGLSHWVKSGHVMRYGDKLHVMFENMNRPVCRSYWIAQPGEPWVGWAKMNGGAHLFEERSIWRRIRAAIFG